MEGSLGKLVRIQVFAWKVSVRPAPLVADSSAPGPCPCKSPLLPRGSLSHPVPAPPTHYAHRTLLAGAAAQPALWQSSSAVRKNCCTLGVTRGSGRQTGSARLIALGWVVVEALVLASMLARVPQGGSQLLGHVAACCGRSILLLTPNLFLGGPLKKLPFNRRLESNAAIRL
ncbi:hypothetical protein FA95DRAFT_1564499 [Auriscalpium vulgare]|uniref:Uncharacterized protein n=1 Tax=Auriscalpium vulgare TaxID=40419 RepID=A0ACB8RDI0_9AGAM|nr:hypothetical protein FA95DRAFT_1564499 [Auriscalpium vulgare]